MHGGFYFGEVTQSDNIAAEEERTEEWRKLNITTVFTKS
jgi:hypothetical protein